MSMKPPSGALPASIQVVVMARRLAAASLCVMVVEGWLERAASARPSHTALETPQGSLSYAELLSSARARAGGLSERGVRPGERVAIAMPPGLGFAQALHACLLLGAVAVPVDLRLPATERELIAEGARVVLDEPLAGSIDAEGSGERGEDPDAGPPSSHDL